MHAPEGARSAGNDSENYQQDDQRRTQPAAGGTAASDISHCACRLASCLFRAGVGRCLATAVVVRTAAPAGCPGARAEPQPPARMDTRATAVTATVVRTSIRRGFALRRSGARVAAGHVSRMLV